MDPVLYFAKAGTYTPALVLIGVQKIEGGLSCVGYIANQPLEYPKKLRQIEPHAGRWRLVEKGLELISPDGDKSSNTFSTAVALEECHE